MGVSWTKEQEQVINLNNRNILVSAAAGSGKTAVLVERIIHKVSREEHPIDIDRLLIVTFTKAAAAEMRERIGLAIEAKVEEEPENEHLQRQLTLIHHAQITTIDSFCMNILRNNFHRIELDPAFRVGDEGELKLLKEDVLTDLMERHYVLGDKRFNDFVDTYATGKDDSSITKLILDFYEFSRSYPWPEEWLKACGDSYALQDAQGMNEQEWMCFLIKQVNMQLDEYLRLYDRMIAICNEEDGPESYLSVIIPERDNIANALGTTDYQSLSKAVRSIAFGRKPRKKKTDMYSDEKAALVSTLRDRVKAGIKSLIKSYFYKSMDGLYEDMLGAGAAVRALVDLTLEFAEDFKAAKQKKNVLDFGDLEHFALDILVTYKDGEMMPTDVANQYSEEFEEIMIDEYQDSNMVQEVLLNSISKERFGRPNVFMVGDVKQSIYKFRLAKPELFMEKYENYTLEDSLYQKIELHKNFRSREEVLQAVNFIFYQIMRKQLGDIDYTNSCALHKGMDYEPFEEECGGATELLLLNLEGSTGDGESDLQLESEQGNDREEDEEAVTDREWEAKLIAARIKELTDPEKGQFIYDKRLKTYRRATYKDIVILLRTMAGWSDPFVQALMNQGIPAYSESQNGYFTTIEIQTILNLLRIIDNPIQDIPLASILKSPIVNLTSEELGKVKIPYINTGLGNGLYGAVLFYMEHFAKEEGDEIYQKLHLFMGKLNQYRKWSSYLPLHELLQKVLNDSGYYEYVCAMPAGERRRANVDMLFEKALTFEATSYRGLFHFIRYIEKLQKFAVDFGEASTISENDNTVRIISIHKSKGLEFPIVFLAGAGKAFNKQDARSRIVFHPDFGIGVDYIDPELRTKTTTLIKKVLQKKLLLENLGEELRVLYVALTRAKEKLIITGAKNRLEEWLQKILSCTDMTDSKMSYEELSTAGCYLDLIIPALSKHRAFAPILEQFKIAAPFQGELYEDEAQYYISIKTKEQLRADENAEKQERCLDEGQLLYWDANHVYDKEAAEKIENHFSFSYHYNDLERTYATMSVSEVKRLLSTEDEEDTAFELIKTTDDLETVPEFLKEKEEANKGAIRGTAYHKFLQLLDYTGDLSNEGIIAQKVSWEQQGKIRPEESNLVWIPDIVKFTKTTLGKRMKEAQELGKLHREQQFIIGIPPSEVSHTTNDEGKTGIEDEIVMIQGVIDAYFEEDGEIVLVDYKTDYVEKENGMQVLLNRYKIQLDYYEKAIKQITGLSVKERLIYSIRLAQSISY